MRLRMGMVGGGLDAMAGELHRRAAALDSRVELVAGALSSTPERSRAAAKAWGLARGYGSWRYRDRHSELLSVEWRWIPSRFALDMAIFYDAGKVTSRRSDLGQEQENDRDYAVHPNLLAL